VRSVAGGLLAILVVAVVARFVGIGRELPYRMEPDASLVFQMQRMAGDPSLVPRDHSTGPYPLVLARVLSWLPHPEVPARVEGPGDERAHLARSARPFLLVRIVVALFSVAGVLLTYPFARRYLSRGGALVATFLAATSLLAILFAGQARPHPVQATFALAAILLALRVRERATWSRILPAVLACVAAISTLQNGVFTVPPLLLAILLGGRRGLRSLASCAIVGVAAVAVALLVFPGMPRIDSGGIHLGSDATGAHTIRPSLSSLAGLPKVGRMLWEFDPLIALLAPVGAVIAYAAWRRTRNVDAWILLAYAVPYAGILALDPNVQERFLLPLVPFLACLAAAPIAFLVAWIAERGGALAASIGAAVLLGAPAVAAGAFARTAAAPDNYEIAAGWIRANVRPDERVLSTPGAVLPLLSDGESMREVLKDQSWLANPWMIYQSLLVDRAAGDRAPGGDPRWKLLVVPVAEWRGGRKLDLARARALLDETRADYVLLEDSVRMHKYYPTEELERAAAARGDLVHRTVGTIPGPSDGLIFEYSGTRDLARRILAAKAFGPGIRIYRIRR
jgi:hypothetical protein